jgi:Domain of unknown function (DUF4124)
MSTFRWIWLALALGLGSSSAFSEVYRWTDSRGKVHFGDRPDANDPQAAQEVVVPRANVVPGFKGTPAAPPAGPTDAVTGGEARVPANPSGAAVSAKPKPAPRGFAAQSKDSCKKKVDAYRASKACFDACGRTNGNGNRNNAGCEHCEDQPMPNC